MKHERPQDGLGIALVAPRPALGLYATPTPSAPLSGHPGEIITTSGRHHVKINRCAYSPVLRHAGPLADTAVPWWGGRQFRFGFS